jgi:hypothetical protein
VYDGCHCFLTVERILAFSAHQSVDRSFRVFDATLSDEPPRAFWRQEHGYGEWNGPDPLQSVRDSVSPLICSVDKRSKYA